MARGKLGLWQEDNGGGNAMASHLHGFPPYWACWSQEPEAFLQSGAQSERQRSG
ncbi:hypothetical protein MJ581_02945 [Escherichia coli]|nr:hypothetical protein MJ581_02945 [Escherichia coli]